MKTICFSLFVLFITGCSTKKDFSKVKKGMKSSEVIALIGEADQKQPMMMVEWWLYNNPEKYIVVIESDTVANAGTQKDLMNGMGDAFKSIDSLKSVLDSAK